MVQILHGQPHKPGPQTPDVVVDEIEDEKPVCSSRVAEEVDDEGKEHHADHFCDGVLDAGVARMVSCRGEKGNGAVRGRSGYAGCVGEKGALRQTPRCKDWYLGDQERDGAIAGLVWRFICCTFARFEQEVICLNKAEREMFV